MLQIAVPMNIGVIKQEMQTYKSDAVNILDNVFVEKGTNYLPFIFKKTEEVASVGKIGDAFEKAGIEIQSIEPTEIAEDGKTEIVLTDTKITTTEGKVYTVLIYGDVNQDGYVDVLDAHKIFLFAKNSDSSIKGNFLKAGNVVNDDDVDVDVLDAHRIFLFVQKGIKLVDIEPAATVTNPKVELVGNENVTIELGESYTQYITKGTAAKAYNRFGVEITEEMVIKHNIANAAGTYTITYEITDTNGAKASATRTLIIKPKPTLTGISVTNNTKPTYNYGTDIDKSTISIKLTYSNGTTQTKTVQELNATILNYDKNVSGTRDITISYNGQSTTTPITVLPKITALELPDMTQTAGEYTVEVTGTTFTLGTIRTIDTTQSPLTIDKLNVSANGTVYEQKDGDKTILSIKPVEKADGSIELQGTAGKAGEYTIDFASSIYEEGTVTILPIKVTVKATLTHVKLRNSSNNEIHLSSSNIDDGNGTPYVLDICYLDQFGNEYDGSNVTIAGIDTNQISDYIDKDIADLGVGDIGYIGPKTSVEGEDPADLLEALEIIPSYYPEGSDVLTGSTGNKPVTHMEIYIYEGTELQDDSGANIVGLNNKELKFVVKVALGTGNAGANKEYNETILKIIID